MTLSNRMKLTDAGSVPSYIEAATVPGMAHFAGSGPADATCGGCYHWQSIPHRGKQHCAQYKQMTGDKVLKPIPSRTWACKYWKAR
jgi:hypothetical protein